jgi:hypothetical protein
VTAGRGNLERATRRGLAAHVGQVEPGVRELGLELSARHARQLALGEQVRHEHGQRLRLKHGDSGGQAGLRGVAGGHHRTADAASPRAVELRQKPAHRAQAAIERELADQQDAFQRVRRHDANCPENAHRDRQVQRGAALAHICWRQVDGDGVLVQQHT